MSQYDSEPSFPSSLMEAKRKAEEASHTYMDTPVWGVPGLMAKLYMQEAWAVYEEECKKYEQTKMR